MRKIQPYYKQNEPEKTKGFLGRGSYVPKGELFATSSKKAKRNYLNTIPKHKEKVQKTT